MLWRLGVIRLYEDDETNAWIEQLDLLESLVGSKWFSNTTMTVVFSFMDEAQRKLKVAPVKNETKGLFLDYDRALSCAGHLCAPHVVDPWELMFGGCT